jgi:hypothetical protein
MIETLQSIVTFLNCVKTLLTSGGRSVGIVRSPTKVTELVSNCKH